MVRTGIKLLARKETMQEADAAIIPFLYRIHGVPPVLDQGSSFEAGTCKRWRARGITNKDTNE